MLLLSEKPAESKALLAKRRALGTLSPFCMTLAVNIRLRLVKIKGTR